jgi:hypothetical protein
LRVAAADQPVEGGFEDFVRNPQLVAHIGDPGDAERSLITVDSQQRPQLGDVELAVGPHGDAAQPHTRFAAQ